VICIELVKPGINEELGEVVAPELREDVDLLEGDRALERVPERVPARLPAILVSAEPAEGLAI
jgi:hypothetical protein